MTNTVKEPKVIRTGGLIIVGIVFCFLMVICSNVFACPCTNTCSVWTTWGQVYDCEIRDCECEDMKLYVLGWDITGTCCTGWCNVTNYTTQPVSRLYECSGHSCDIAGCTVPSEPDYIAEGNVPVVDCACCETPCNTANCEECKNCSCQSRCNPNQCQKCVDGSCVNGCCTLETYVFEDAGCDCDGTCYRTGSVFIIRLCVGEEDCYGNCYCKDTPLALQLTEMRPNCEDIGLWPPGPGCNEKEDCANSGYEEIYNMSVNTCACVPYGT